jgi:Cu(I)/Ag(I) efflux system membrane fusion protein
MNMSGVSRWTLVVAVLAAGLAVSCSQETAARAGKTAELRSPRYICPMHPAVTADKPGSCPICGMDLVPLQERDAEHEGSTPGVPERAPVQLSAERRQLLGLRSEPVLRTRLVREIRTVGRVAVDERRVSHIHAKVEGYVEHLHADFTGRQVRRGERLLSIYSPELVATQQEYLLALRARERLAKSGIESVVKGGEDLLEAARQRLLLWDVPPDDIAELEHSGQVRRTLDLRADQSGTVFQKNVVHGMRVMPSDTLFDIADLSRLWVLADVYEADLGDIRIGMRADLRVAHMPDRSWRGPVTYIAPVVEEKSRTVKVRIEVGNEAGLLKPDMYADVHLRIDLGEGLVVPEDSVIDAGDRRLAFVELAGGRLEPREVELGARVKAGTQVLRGLAEGDRVVTSANFLVDSESSLRAALAAMTPQPPAGREH